MSVHLLNEEQALKKPNRKNKAKLSDFAGLPGRVGDHSWSPRRTPHGTACSDGLQGVLPEMRLRGGQAPLGSARLR